MEKLNNNKLTWLNIARREGFKRIERNNNKIFLYSDIKTISFDNDKNIVDLSNLNNLKIYDIEDLCIYNQIKYVGYFVEIRDHKDMIIFKSCYCDSILNLFRDVINGIDKFKKTMYIKKVVVYIDNDGNEKRGFKILKKFDNVEEFKKYTLQSD